MATRNYRTACRAGRVPSTQVCPGQRATGRRPTRGWLSDTPAHSPLQAAAAVVKLVARGIGGAPEVEAVLTEPLQSG